MALHHDRQADLLLLPNADAVPRPRISAVSPFNRVSQPRQGSPRYSCQPRLYSIRTMPECYKQYTLCRRQCQLIGGCFLYLRCICWLRFSEKSEKRGRAVEPPPPQSHGPSLPPGGGARVARIIQLLAILLRHGRVPLLPAASSARSQSFIVRSFRPPALPGSDTPIPAA